METIINSVLSQMQNMLDPSQLKHLAEVLSVTLLPTQETSAPQNLLTLFLTAKEVEGCSPKTIAYYESTLQHMTTQKVKGMDSWPATSRAGITAYRSKKSLMPKRKGMPWRFTRRSSQPKMIR